jgi:predicted nucleotide-binding protein
MLEQETRPRLWSRAFEPGQYPLDVLKEQAEKADFAVLIFTPDDKLNIRRANKLTPRDNVVFECGFFMGRLGRERTFVLVPRGLKNFRILTDLLGLTAVFYETGAGDHPNDVLDKPCTEILDAIRKRHKPTVQGLDDLASSLEGKLLHPTPRRHR